MPMSQLGRLRSTWDYRVYTVGLVYIVERDWTKGDLSDVPQGTDNVAVLNAVITALPSARATCIFIDCEGVNFLGYVNITNKKRITITSYSDATENAYGTEGVTIRTLVLTASSSDIIQCIFYGLQIKSITWNPSGGFSIRHNTWIYCKFNTSDTSGSHGLVLNTTGASGECVDYQDFIKCNFIMTNDNALEGGLLTTKGDGSNSVWKFEECNFLFNKTGVKMIVWADGGYFDRARFINCILTCGNDAYSYEYLHYTAQTAGNLGGGVSFEHCTMETHGTVLMVNIAHCPNGLIANAKFHSCDFSGWTALTVITNANDDWSDRVARVGLVVEENRFMNTKPGSAPAIGTTGESALFKVRIKDNDGLVTKKSGTGTGNGAQQTIAHGLAATPKKVILSEYLTGGALARQSAAADATNIYITATNAKDYLWVADCE